MPFMQVLNYSDAFHEQVYHKQVDLVKNHKLKAESYFSVLPSGDIISDADLDMFLCDQMFEEEFEYTVADQSSVAPSLRFSIGKTDSRSFSLNKWSNKPNKGAASKFRKLASFNLGESNMHQVEDAIRSKEGSSKYIDMSHISHNNSLQHQDSFLSSSPLDDEMLVSPSPMKSSIIKQDGLFIVPEQPYEFSPEHKFSKKSTLLTIKPLPTDIIAEEVKEHDSKESESSKEARMVQQQRFESKDTPSSKKDNIQVPVSNKGDSDSSLDLTRENKSKEVPLQGLRVFESPRGAKGSLNQKSFDTQPKRYQMNSPGSDGILQRETNEKGPTQPGLFSAVVSKRIESNTGRKGILEMSNSIADESPMSNDGALGYTVQKPSELRNSNTCTKCSQDEENSSPSKPNRVKNSLDIAENTNYRNENERIQTASSLRPSHTSTPGDCAKTIGKASEDTQNDEERNQRSYSGSKSNDLLSDQEYITSELRNVLVQHKAQKTLKIPSRVERDRNIENFESNQIAPRVSNSNNSGSNGTTSPGLNESPAKSRSSRNNGAVGPSILSNSAMKTENKELSTLPIYNLKNLKQFVGSHSGQGVVHKPGINSHHTTKDDIKPKDMLLRQTLSGPRNESSPLQRDVPVKNLIRDSAQFVPLYMNKKSFSLHEQDDPLLLERHSPNKAQQIEHKKPAGPYQFLQGSSERGAESNSTAETRGHKTERFVKPLTTSVDTMSQARRNSKKLIVYEPLKLSAQVKSTNEQAKSPKIKALHDNNLNLHPRLLKMLNSSQSSSGSHTLRHFQPS